MLQKSVLLKEAIIFRFWWWHFSCSFRGKIYKTFDRVDILRDNFTEFYIKIFHLQIVIEYGTIIVIMFG